MQTPEEGYHFTEDMTDKAIGWIGQQKALIPRQAVLRLLRARRIYHKGWTAVTRHKTPWLLVGENVPAFDDDVWERYDTTKDWSQSKNLAKEMPDMLHHLQRLCVIDATRFNVLPLDDRVAERMNPDLAGRPVLIKGKTQILFGGMGRHRPVQGRADCDRRSGGERRPPGLSG